MTTPSSRRLLNGSIAILALLFAACHDAPRKNPFDPALTPSVELSAALNDSTGAVALQWTPYAGEISFSRYLILRRAAESARVDTLATIENPDSTTWIDRTLLPQTDYIYRVSVINVAGFEMESTAQITSGYSVGAVQLFAVASDASRGVLRLRWSRYGDPGFEQYRLLRRIVGTDREEELSAVAAVGDTSYADATALAEVDYIYEVLVDAAGQEPEVIAEITVVDLTQWTDRGLHGDTDYFYRVVVETERGEQVQSQEVAGTLHAYVGEWALDLSEGEVVRLYLEKEGELTALVAGPERVRLLFFDLEGNERGEQLLLDNPFVDEPLFGAEWSPARMVSTLLREDGRRWLSFASERSGLVGVVEYDAEGEMVWREEEVFAGQLQVDGDAVFGEWALFQYSEVTFNGTLLAPPVAAFTVVEVEVDRVFQVEGLDFLDPTNWKSLFVFPSKQNRLVSAPSRLISANLTGNKSILESLLYESAWNEYAMHIKQIIMSGGAGLRLQVQSENSPGIFLGDLFSLSLDIKGQRAVLFTFDRQPESIIQGQQETPFPILAGVPYGLRLRVNRGGYTASVEHALAWSGPMDEQTPFAALTEVDGVPIIATGATPHLITGEGEPTAQRAVEEGISEMRSWTRQQRSRIDRWVGLCLPDQHQILYARAGINTHHQQIQVALRLAEPHQQIRQWPRPGRRRNGLAALFRRRPGRALLCARRGQRAFTGL